MDQILEYEMYPCDYDFIGQMFLLELLINISCI